MPLPPPEPGLWKAHPQAPEPGTVIAAASEFVDGDAREFRFGEGGGAFSMFVVRRDEAFFAYVNKCPHFGTPLNERKPSFLTEDSGRIRCSTHFSEYRIEDGLGIAGHGEGCWLDAVPIAVRDGDIVIM